MDQGSRRHFVESVMAMHEAGDRLPAVPLEVYLTGNTDDASLGRGMRRDFHLATYASVLRELAARDDVDGVFVEVHELPKLDEPDDDDMWAQAFVIYVVTSMMRDEVLAAVSSLCPRAVDEGWGLEPGIQPPLEEVTRPLRPLRVELG